MKEHNFNFQGKYIIRLDLRCLTGLHIGGTVEGIEIGGIDNPVIKDPLTGYPYIPGSSLKGKLRCLLEWSLDKVYQDIKTKEAPPHTCENDPEIKAQKGSVQRLEMLREKIASCPICRIFGFPASAEIGEPTRLTVRDSYPSNNTKELWKNNLGEGLYTELKTENAIDRITSMANPRPLERVPKDSVFEVEMIYDIYHPDDEQFIKYLFQAMHLLEDSFLGGSGSRGSGKVKFENPKIVFRCKENYYKKTNGEESPIDITQLLKDASSDSSIPKKLFDDFDQIPWIIKQRAVKNEPVPNNSKT